MTDNITITNNNNITILELEKLRINPDYEKIVPTLAIEQYDSLKQSLLKTGFTQPPIIINKESIILDGHNRYKICRELGIEPKVSVLHFENPLHEKEYVISSNLNRRQLNDLDKAKMGTYLEEIEKEKAKERQSEAGKMFGKGKDSLRPKNLNLLSATAEGTTGRVTEIVAKKIGLSETTYKKAKKVIEQGTEEQKTRIRKGLSTINRESSAIRKEELKEELKTRVQNQQQDIPNCKLFNEDFTKLSSDQIPDNSIDLIFTDPPYDRDSVWLYGDLAKLAERVLKPGGSLITYSGHINLDKVFAELSNFPLLKYWWLLCIEHSGHTQRVHNRHMIAEFKPMVFYVKGDQAPPALDTMRDIIVSKAPTKIEHEWQQSTVESDYIIKHLTIENQVVLDPMFGSGTTGIAALELKRKFVGCEIDKESFEIGKARIGKEGNIQK